MAGAGSSSNFMSHSSQEEIVFDLGPHISWLMKRTTDFFRVVITLQSFGLLSDEEVEQLKNTTVYATEEQRAHRMYTLIGKRTRWFAPLVKALLENGNSHLVEYLMEKKESAIAAGTVIGTRDTIDINVYINRILKLEEELDFYKNCRQNGSSESLRKEIQSQGAVIEKQDKEITKTKEENRVLLRRVEELESENLRLQNIITTNVSNKTANHSPQITNDLVTINDKGTSENPLNYEKYSSEKMDDFKTMGLQTLNLNFEYINLHVLCLIQDFQYFKKLKTFKVKHGKLTGVVQHRQFSASLPDLEIFALHLRKHEWRPAWNTNYESFSNSLLFFGRLQGPILPMPKELLELTEHKSLRLKVSQKLGEIIISGLEFVDYLLQLPTVRGFHLLRLALESCTLLPSVNFPTSSLTSLTLINVDIDTMYLQFLLQECKSLEVLQLKFLNREVKQFILDHFRLRNIRHFALSNAEINLGNAFPTFPYKLRSLYFHNCLVDPRIVKNFERIFDCSKFAFTCLVAHDFLSHELLVHILRSQSTKWVHMSHFDRNPKNCEYYKVVEKCLTTAGIPKSATSFVLVKDANNNWTSLNLDKTELKKILNAMNGSDKFEAID